MIPESSYINRSGQKWKVILSFSLLGIGGVLISIGWIFQKRMSEGLFVVIMLTGVFLACSGFS